ncbi:hypothetical protein K461DRAFT_322075 [Myriangium duriaei CBS 260.36]|uniref:ABC transporter n=1 Tax=Myriangium duriaei CBS 260.36 TaxID=1168546 RepID=A0A9P4IXX9_9PEZI|nr:hypothetical protein K461DRAFT_322075 [Myriangium duriaei CBS 260.36]
MSQFGFGKRVEESTDGFELQPIGSVDSEDKPPPQSDDAQSDSVPYSVLFLFTKRFDIKWLVIGVVTAILRGLAAPAAALVTGRIFGFFTSYQNGDISGSDLTVSVSRWTLYLLAVGMGKFMLQSVFFASWDIFGETQARRARRQVFLALLEKDNLWFEGIEEGTAALIIRLNAQINDLQMATSQPLGAIPGIIANACFSFALAMYYSWQLTLVIMASIPVVIIFIVLTNIPLAKYLHKQQQKQSTAAKLLSGAIKAIDIVKCYNAQTFEMNRYIAQIQEVAHWFLKAININAQHQGFVQFVASCVFVQAFYFGGTLVHSGEKTPGEIITTTLSAVAVFVSLNSINSQSLYLESGRIAGGKMRDILSHEGRDTDTHLSRRLARREASRQGEGQIRFENVTFAYAGRPDSAVFKELSMTIPMDSTTFIVGKSGSGKSTIGQLLTRLYEPSSGRITVTIYDKPQDLTVFSKKSLRQYIHLVEQQSILFDDTIDNNIALGHTVGREFVDEYGIAEAAEFALLRLLICKLPKRGQTQVGRGGEALSGGQRQRVALARAYIRNAPVLILDESTSALDKASGKLMMNAIRNWRLGKTTIIITHDLELIEQDDYVLVLDEGILINQGSRRNLIQIDDFMASFSATARPETSSPDSQSSLSIQSSLDLFTSTSSSMRIAARRHTLSSECEIGLATSSIAAGPITRTQQSPEITSTPLAESFSGWNRSDLRLNSVPWSQGSPSLSPRLNDSETHPLFSPPASAQRLEERFGCITAVDTTATLAFRSIFGTAWHSLNSKRLILLTLGVGLCVVHSAALPVLSLLSTKLIENFSFDGESQKTVRTYAFWVVVVAVIDGTTVYLQYVVWEYVAQCWINHIRIKAVAKLLAQPKEFFNMKENAQARLVETMDRHADLARDLLGKMAPLYIMIFTVSIISATWATIAEWRLSLVMLVFLPVIVAWAVFLGNVDQKWNRFSNNAIAEINAVFVETFTSIRTVKLLTADDHFHGKADAAIQHAYKVGIRRALVAGIMSGVTEAGQVVAQAAMFYYAAKLAVNGVSVPSMLLVLLLLIMTFSQVGMMLGAIPQAALARDAATRLLRLATLPEDSHESEGGTYLGSAGPIELRNVSFAYPSTVASTVAPAVSPYEMPRDSLGAEGVISQGISFTETSTDLPPLAVSSAVCGSGASSKGKSSAYPSTMSSIELAPSVDGSVSEVLRDVSLRFEPGKYVALVGSSGAGKSSVAHLLLRLYSLSGDAGSGELLISGRSISEYTVISLRSRIAFVHQSSSLLAGTIAANIAYGLPSASPAQIRAVGASVGLAAFIESLPRGFETVVGDGGQGLSGGQQQRLAIARALVREPDVLILDEATSALDGESAAWIRDCVLDLVRRGTTGGRPTTVVAITHDRRMMECADRVVVMDSGEVVEEGGFRELLLSGGRLAQLLDGGVGLK